MMKLRIAICAALFAVTGSAFAHEVIYAGMLSGLNEVPANNSAGFGNCVITMDLDLATMRVQANFAGLTGNTSASHIHFGSGPGTNGGVATMLPSFTGFPLGVKAGSYDRTFDMSLASSYNPAFVTANGGTVGGAFNAFLTKLGQGFGYLNIHTTSFTGGEIRANLTAVPEPSTYLVMGIGAAAVMLRRRKK